MTADTAISPGRMSRRAWALFAALGLIWGIPYLFIKIAVLEISPIAVAGWRTAIAGVMLLSLAAYQRSLLPALRAWPFVVAFGVLEMALPWVLLGQAEKRVPSAFAALMLATVPALGTVVSWLTGDRGALARIRLIGLVAGVLGVAALVGLDWTAGTIDLTSVLELLVAAACYALAPALADRKLAHVPSIGVVSLSLTAVALVYAPATVFSVHAGLPSPKVVGSVVVLALVCTALALVLFFRLMAEAGPARATVVTFVNPAVAVSLSVIVLGEPLTLGILVGFPLVLLGSYWATREPPRSIRSEDGLAG